MTTTLRLQTFLRRNPYLLALLLLVIALAINYSLQDNLFETSVMNRNLRTFLPAIILAVGQTIVVLGGGIDLSVGAIVSMTNAILVTLILPDSGAGAIALGIAAACLAGMGAGLVNGLAVAYLRLQPIVTTYATSFIFAGVALWILPRPGGEIPRDLSRFYRSPLEFGGGEEPWLEIPLAFVVIAVLLLVWGAVRSTRYARFLYATGDRAAAAYTTGVPVDATRLSTYVMSGLFAALAALALTMNTGSGSPRIGDAMTLPSIVAVVLGGTRLSGGQGGIAGSMIGVIILGIIRNIISFADVPTWSQTLVDALIIVTALAAPGLVRLASDLFRQYRISRGRGV